MIAPMSPLPTSEQAEAGDGEPEKKKEDSKRDLLQRANSSPVGFRPKRKDSGNKPVSDVTDNTFSLYSLLSFPSPSFFFGLLAEYLMFYSKGNIRLYLLMIFRTSDHSIQIHPW